MTTTEQISEIFASNRDNLVKMYASRAGQDDVEDVIQEGFYRALLYKDSFNDKFTTMENWITSILNNCLKDSLREKRDGKAMHDSEEEPTINDRCPSDVELERKIVDDISNKRSETRQILWLYFKMGHKLEEIQRILSCSYTNVNRATTDFRLRCQDKYGHLMRD